jgi:hypothetical protein
MDHAANGDDGAAPISGLRSRMLPVMRRLAKRRWTTTERVNVMAEEHRSSPDIQNGHEIPS